MNKISNILALVALAGAIIFAISMWGSITKTNEIIACFPTDTINAGSQIIGVGNVDAVISPETFWINPGSDEQLQSFEEVADTACKKDRILLPRKVVQIRLGSINAGDDVHRWAGAPKPALPVKEYLDLLLTNQAVEYRCFGHDEQGLPICSISVQGIDLGVHLILRGYGRYQQAMRPHPWLDDAYTKASDVVRARGAGS